jgi:hypothetical protein
VHGFSHARCGRVRIRSEHVNGNNFDSARFTNSKYCTPELDGFTGDNHPSEVQHIQHL